LGKNKLCKTKSTKADGTGCARGSSAMGASVKIERLKELLKKEKARYAILFCHHNADPDAIFAAYVFSNLLRKLKPRLRCDIVAAEGTSALSKQLMTKLAIKLVEKPNLQKANFIAIVDTSTTKQLGNWESEVTGSEKPLLILDHHTIHPKTKKHADLILVDREARATCELVHELCGEAGYSLKRRESLALFWGIAYETKGLRYASTKTLRIVTDLAERGVKVADALSAMTKPLSRSDKFARLKAASRLKIHKAEMWTLASSHVNSHESSAARALLALGADVAVVGGKKGKKVRLSLRATSNFVKETAVHLGRDVAMPSGEMISGMGGGHSAAAGVNGSGDLFQAISKAVKLLEAKIYEATGTKAES